MTKLQTLLLVAALGLAVWAIIQNRATSAELKQMQHGAQYLDSSLKNFKEESQRALQVTRTHLGRINAGEKLDPEMVQEGIPWADINAEQAKKLIEHDPQVLLLDVRTPGEYSRGHIPGAVLVPVDDLSRRIKELPEDKMRPILVHCQSGGRSLAAVDYLSSQGFGALYNLRGGVGAWKGTLEQGN